MKSVFILVRAMILALTLGAVLTTPAFADEHTLEDQEFNKFAELNAARRAKEAICAFSSRNCR